MIKLSPKDSQAFVETLLNPPEPNEWMIAAAKKYKRSVAQLLEKNLNMGECS